MSHSHSSAGRCAGRLLGVLLAAGAALPAQLDPGCLYTFEPPTPPSPEPMRYLWGGEMRHVFARTVADVHHTWVVGDGGIVRHRVGTGAWQIQSTPAEAKWSLHDVFFLKNSLIGWAAGNGGRILNTVDGGVTWTLLPPTLLNCKGEPAVIWRVRFIDTMNGFANGLGLFRYTTDGGQTWSPVQLNGALASMFEWYALDVVGDANGFVAVAAGQQWSGAHCPPDGTAGSAQVFRLATNIAGMGTSWSWPQLPAPAFEDPWDIEFEPNPANYAQAVGYMSGGTGTAAGVVLRTTDSGATWRHDVTAFQHPTMYGIAVRDANTAVGVGYAGTVLWRDATGPQWKLRKYNANGFNFTAPLGDAHYTDEASPTCVIAGSWGFLRSRSDFSQANPTPPGTWANLNPQSAETIDTQHRYFDVCFRDDMVGCAVGQLGAFVHTSDGGCSWTEIPQIATSQYILGVDCSVSGKYAVAVGRGDGNQAMLARTADFDVTPPTLPSWTWVTDATLANTEFVDVDFLVGQEVWAVGYDVTTFQPVLLQSSDALGTVWSATPAFVPDFAPTGLVCIGGREAIVVGYSRSSLEPRAYEVTNVLGQFVEVAIVCPPGLTGKLRDVAGRGTSLAACDVLAVGGDEGTVPSNGSGYVLQYVPGSGPTAPMLSLVTLPETLNLECTAIDMAGGGFAMVGLRQRPNEAYTEDLGDILVRSTGVNPTWSVARSRTNKTVQAIHVMSNLRAWIIAKSEATDISAEFATVNDSCFLLWDPE